MDYSLLLIKIRDTENDRKESIDQMPALVYVKQKDGGNILEIKEMDLNPIKDLIDRRMKMLTQKKIIRRLSASRHEHPKNNSFAYNHALNRITAPLNLSHDVDNRNSTTELFENESDFSETEIVRIKNERD